MTDEEVNPLDVLEELEGQSRGAELRSVNVDEVWCKYRLIAGCICARAFTYAEYSAPYRLHNLSIKHNIEK